MNYLLISGSSCLWCKRLLHYIKNKIFNSSKGVTQRTYFSPNKKKIFSNVQRAKKIVAQKCNRANRKISKLQQNLYNCKKQMKEINNSSLSKLLENHNISKDQCGLIHEIFAAAKLKNTKNRRYSENWILLCLLFQIRLLYYKILNYYVLYILFTCFLIQIS